MPSQKKRNRARKRVFALLQDAWDALDRGEHLLAEKIAKRAVAEGSVNPRVWVEHGRLLCAVGKDRNGERALRHAIAMAPTYGEAFAALAWLKSERGNFDAAVRLQRRAVELGREHADDYRADLAGYEEKLIAQGGVLPPAGEMGAEDGGAAGAAGAGDADAGTGDAVGGDRPRVPSAVSVGFDWQDLAERLLKKGIVRLPGLCDDDEVAALEAALSAPGVLGWRRVLGAPAAEESEEGGVAESPVDEDHDAVGGGPHQGNDPTPGSGWAEPAGPLAEPLRALRADLYVELRQIAIDWAHRTRRDPRFPGSVEEFLRSCAAVEQARCGISHGVFPAGTRQPVVAPDRTSVRFPLAVLLALDGPVACELEDLRPGKKRRVTEVRLRRGDAAVFAWGERMVQIAGVFGLQPVGWGVGPVDEERGARVLLLRMHDIA